MNLINLKTAFRNLLKNKLLSLLNILGLGTGLAVAILIFNYSYTESRADKFHKNIDNIYLLQNTESTRVHYEMEPLIREQVAAIEHIVMVESHFRDKIVLQYKTEESIKTDLVFTESDFLKIFSFDLVSGNLENALEAPHSIILTESEAKKIFGNKNALGESVSLKGNPIFFGESEVTVKAIIKDIPANSNLQFKALVSRSTAKKMMPWIKQCVWSCRNVQNYLTLKEGQDPDILAAQMNAQLRPFIPEKINCEFSFFPYSEAYFSSIRDDFKHGNIRMIYTLSSIAILILLIATINYINLSMAGSAKRLTEVGVRKIAGVKPIQLIGQLLGESVLLSTISILIGLALAKILSPAINSLSVINLPKIPLHSFAFWLVLAGTSVIIGILAGLTPALALNKFRPISLITGRTSNIGSGLNLKRGLIVFQFAVSIILIVCTFTVTKQLSFVRKQNLGFETEQVINVQLSPQVKTKIFRDKLNQIAGIENVSFSRWFPGNIKENWVMPLVYKGEETKVKFACENADDAYIDIMDLDILKGRNFSDSLVSDKRAAIINETAVKEWGLEKPFQAYFSKNGESRKIIGVVKDFNFQSLHSDIKPMVIFNEKEQVYSANIKLAVGSFNTISTTLDQINSSWKEVSPGFPFEYKFIDAEVENLYKTEIVFGKIFSYGSAFAIFISCLGLFGLVLGSTEQRRKEIGIRKVNGAKIGEILIMLNKDFIKWVGIAFVIAAPIAWYLMKNWLQNFAYKTNLSWWIFAVAGMLALGIALLTVSWQSWRAATKNPVEALHYE